jgi:tyrosine-protein kinase Etk/Wzc
MQNPDIPMERSTETPVRDDGRPFAHAVFVLLRHWRFLTVATLTAMVFSVAVAFLSPVWYKSQATFLPPQRQPGMLERLAGGLSTTLRTMGISGMGSEGSYDYLSVLQSRSIGEKIIREFDLIRMYRIGDGSMEKALKELEGNTEFTVEKLGMVTIAVWDRDPDRATRMANAYFRHLNELSSSMNAAEARANRQFVQLQYESVRDSLRLLEQRFVSFQKRTGLYSLPEQTEASLKAAGESYAMLSLNKVYLGILERNLGREDPSTRAQRVAVEEFEKAVPGVGTTSIPGMPGASTKTLPDEALEYMRMYRDLETLSKLQGFLLPIYQQAVLDEQKQMTVLVPLDPAQRPERKDRPKRMIIILVVTMSIFILAITYLLLRDGFLRYRRDHSSEWGDVVAAMRFRPRE